MEQPLVSASVEERAAVGRSEDALVPARPRSLGGWWRRTSAAWRPTSSSPPFFILFALFLAYPIAQAFWISLHEWPGIGEMEWVGWGNLRRRAAGRKLSTNAAINTACNAAASLLLICPWRCCWRWP